LGGFNWNFKMSWPPTLLDSSSQATASNTDIAIRVIRLPR